MNFIDEKIIVPMNEWAKRHPYLPLTISAIALLVSLMK